MPTSDHYLYFYTPCLQLRDIRIALDFMGKCNNPEALFIILKTHRRTFNDYPAIEKALRDYYGFAKEVKNQSEKESPESQVKKTLFRESALKGLDWSQKQKVGKVEKIFKGRYI